MEYEQLLARVEALERENAELRQTVKKGRDVAKALSDRYADKLKEQQEQDQARVQTLVREMESQAALLAQLRQSEAKLREQGGPTGMGNADAGHGSPAKQGPPVVEASNGTSAGQQQQGQGVPAGVGELVSNFRLLEEAVSSFVLLSSERERALNGTIHDLARVLRRRDKALDWFERDEEVTEDRLLRLEGRVRAVIRGCQEWYLREQQLVASLKEEAEAGKCARERELRALQQLEQAQKSAAMAGDEADRLRMQLMEAQADIAALRQHIGAGSRTSSQADIAPHIVLRPEPTQLKDKDLRRSDQLLPPGRDAPVPRKASMDDLSPLVIHREPSPQPTIPTATPPKQRRPQHTRGHSVSGRVTSQPVLTSDSTASAEASPRSVASPRSSLHNSTLLHNSSAPTVIASAPVPPASANPTSPLLDHPRALDNPALAQVKMKTGKRRSVRSSQAAANAEEDAAAAQTLAEVEAEIASLLGRK